MADNSEEANRILESLAQSMSKHMQQQDDLTKELAAAEAQQQKVNDSLKKFQTYMKDFGSTMVSADRGTAKYGGVVTGATDAMGNLIMKLGPLGVVVGLLVKAFGGLAAASLKQNEALIKSFRNLSEFGAIDSSGVQGMLDTLHKVGATSEDMENFQKVVRAIAPDLASLGGTVSKGVKQISDVTGAILDNKQLETSLKGLGYSTEQILEYTGKFIGTQARNGAIQGKTTADLTKQATDYMKVMAEVSMLTGLQRDEQQKLVDEQQRDIRWRLYLSTLNPNDAIKAQEGMLALSSQNKGMAEQVKDQLVMSGGVTSEFTAMMASQYPKLAEQFQSVVKGGGDITAGIAKVMEMNLPNMQRHISTFANTVRAGGKETGDALAVNVELMDTVARVKTTKATDGIAEMQREIEKLSHGADNRMKLETERERAERKTANAMDDLKFTVGNAVVPAMTNLAKVVEKVGSGLAEFTKFITFGKVDFTGLFKSFNDMEEVTSTIAIEDKKQLELKEKIRVEDEYIVKAKAALAAQEKLEKTNPYEAMLKAGSMDAVRRNMARAEEKRAALREQMSTSTSNVARAKTAGTVMNANAETTVSDTKGDPLKGLKVKKGDVHKEGAPVDDRLVKLMNAVQGNVPGFSYISSINDQFHQNRNSKHKEGKAFDFTLGEWPTEEQGRKISALIKMLAPELGDKLKIIDEYNHPSAGSTGGHMHAEIQAKTGAAMLKGPESGYWARLHGNEGVFNEKQMASLSNAITKTPISGGGSNPTSAFDTASMLDVFGQMNEKLETLVDKFSKSLDVQENILTYSKA
jgi:hypothetical protein